MTVTREQIEQTREQLHGIVSDWSCNDETSDYHTAKLNALCALALQALDSRRMA
jgi:hypothetical protein